MDRNFFTSGTYRQVVTATVRPFVLEYEGNFQEAIGGHEAATKTLKGFLETHKKNLGKFHRKMFERQIEVHDERRKYLESFKGMFKGVVVPPTIRSADAEFLIEQGQARPLSLVSVST